MKRYLVPFFIFAIMNLCYALTVEEVLRDIQNLPAVKIKPVEEEPKKEEPEERRRYEQIKAVQIFVLPSDKKELHQLFSKWQQNGINTVIVRCFHNKGDRYHGGVKTGLKEGVYFKTDLLPVLHDTLSEVTSVAKQYGLKVVAWMTTRYAAYGNENLENLVAYSVEKHKYVETKGLNIFSADVQKHLLRIFDDLSSYPVDGILLQDDLFLRYNEGFNHSTIKEFEAETGIPITPETIFEKNGKNIYNSDRFWELRRWKSKKLTEFVSRIKRKIKQNNPEIKLFVNLTYEAVSNPKGALAWLAHDLNLLKEVADYFSLMAYHRQIMEELNLNMAEAKKYIAEMINQCLLSMPDTPQRFLFKLQVKDWRTNEPIDESEIRTLLSSARGIEQLSVAIVPYPPDLSVTLLKEIFGRKVLSKTALE